jgi:hypothetical protein
MNSAIATGRWPGRDGRQFNQLDTILPVALISFDFQSSIRILVAKG